MKKIILKFECLMLLLILLFTNVTAYANEALSLETEILEYEITYRIGVINGEKTLYADYVITNHTQDKVKASLIGALYKGEKFIKIKAQTVEVERNGVKQETLVVPLPEDGVADYSIKLMLWESLNSIKPLGKAKLITDLSETQKEKIVYVTAREGQKVNLYMNFYNDSVNENKIHRITFNPDAFDISDLCAFTYQKEITIGVIENTDIEIISIDTLNGEICFKINSSAENISGPLNAITFITKNDISEEEILYTIN